MQIECSETGPSSVKSLAVSSDGALERHGSVKVEMILLAPWKGDGDALSRLITLISFEWQMIVPRIDDARTTRWEYGSGKGCSCEHSRAPSYQDIFRRVFSSAFDVLSWDEDHT